MKLRRGCFGHIVTFNPGVALCADCEFAGECADIVSERVLKLRKLGRYPTLEVGEPALRSDLSASMVEASPIVGKPMPNHPPPFNKKAKECADTLRARGIDLRAGLRAGINPIPDRPAFIKLAFDELLHKEVIIKTDLKQLFMEELGWKPQTAASHVGIVASLFGGLGLAEDRGREIVRYAV